MKRRLTSFADLVLQAQRGEDYDLVVRDRGATVTILALHGGTIEPLTEQLAMAVAGDAWNLYALYGLQPSAADLRLPTLRLAEVRCDALLQHSALALAITGCAEGEEALVGGRNARLVHALCEHLATAGLPVAETGLRKAEALAMQCYNRTRWGGAQLTLPLALRRGLTPVALRAVPPGEMPLFTDLGWALINAVREAVHRCLHEQSTDLVVTLDQFERATRAAQASGLLGSTPKSQAQRTEEEA